MEILIALTILIFSAILHEIMHGVVADKLGDPTARLLGRLTLNPIPHIDPIMSVLMPVIMFIASQGHFFFAAAKPVPVNPIHFKDPKKDLALTALAGPLTNFSIAIIAALILRVAPAEQLIQYILFITVQINLMLGIFNLIPIPPLDGSKVIASVLPTDMAYTYLSIERYGMLILFVLIFGPFPFGQIINNLISFSLRLLGLY